MYDGPKGDKSLSILVKMNWLDPDNKLPRRQNQLSYIKKVKKNDDEETVVYHVA